MFGKVFGQLVGWLECLRETICVRGKCPPGSESLDLFEGLFGGAPNVSGNASICQRDGCEVRMRTRRPCKTPKWPARVRGSEQK